MGSSLGDRAPGATLMFFFNTRVNGVAVTLDTSPAAAVYKNNTTESTSGVTLNVDYDNRTGLHQVLVDTSADSTFYAADNDFDVVLTAGQFGGLLANTLPVGSFRLSVKESNIDKASKAIARGTVTTGASTTSVPTSALTINGSAASGVVADQFKNRTILFDGGTTTAGLRGASAAISANTASNTPTLTVGTLPATPASGDLFSVI